MSTIKINILPDKFLYINIDTKTILINGWYIYTKYEVNPKIGLRTLLFIDLLLDMLNDSKNKKSNEIEAIETIMKLRNMKI